MLLLGSDARKYHWSAVCTRKSVYKNMEPLHCESNTFSFRSETKNKNIVSAYSLSKFVIRIITILTPRNQTRNQLDSCKLYL